LSSIAKSFRSFTAVLVAALMVLVPINLSVASADQTTDIITVTWEGNTTPVEVTEGTAISLPSRITQVAVAVTPLVPGSQVDIEGATDLEVGRNELYITITHDDVVSLTKAFLDVAPHSAELASVTVNGEDVVFGNDPNVAWTVLTLPHGTDSIEVEVETVDPDATYEIEIVQFEDETQGCYLGNGCGSFGYAAIYVTAPDGTQNNKWVHVYVERSDNSSVQAVTVNGFLWDQDEDVVEVDAGEIEVLVDTENEFATTVITVAPTEGTVGGTATVNGSVITASGYITANIVVVAQDGTQADPLVLNLIASTDLEVYNGSNPADDTVRVGTFAKTSFEAVVNALKFDGKQTNRWLADGAYVTGATTSRLMLTVEDLTQEIRPVVYTAQEFLVGKKVEVGLGIIKKTPAPSILGKAAIGNTLKAIPKAWTQDVELSYEWFVNYEDSESEAVATGEEFVLAADALVPGDVVMLSVTGSLEGYSPVEMFSSKLTVMKGNLKITTKPEITADPGFVTGATLTLNPGELSAEAEPTVVWYRNGVVVADQTDVEYAVTPADFKSKLTAVITYTLEGYNTLTTKVNTPFIKAGLLEEVEAPTIEANAELTALTAVGGFSGDVAPSSIRYTWYRNGRAVLDAKSATYVLQAKDRGAKISLRVVANYSGYVSTSTVVDPEEGVYLVPKQ
jgi:hypothetical protein